MEITFNAAVSSIRAHERKLGVTAHNVANVNTNGFKRERAILQEGTSGDVRVRVRREDTPTPADPLAPDAPEVERSLSNVDLADEMHVVVTTDHALILVVVDLDTIAAVLLGSLAGHPC